ncbi:MAG: proton-conducting transporter membrane subunit [Caldilineaceae bacterium]
MLLAILGIYFATGTFNILEAAAAQPFAGDLTLASLAFWGLFLGFAFKVPSFPFTPGLPDAHTEAPTAGSVILAGVLLKLGAYGSLRMMLPTFPNAAVYWAPWLVALGAIAIVYGAFVCVAQTDLKRLIAYSSASHMGYVVLGIGAAATVMTPDAVAAAASNFGVSPENILDSATMAINGAALQMFNHGIITGALVLPGRCDLRTGAYAELSAFGGLAGEDAALLYGLMMVAAFASLGLPGLAGFLGGILHLPRCVCAGPLLGGLRHHRHRDHRRLHSLPHHPERLPG